LEESEDPFSAALFLFYYLSLPIVLLLSLSIDYALMRQSHGRKKAEMTTCSRPKKYDEKGRQKRGRNKRTERGQGRERERFSAEMANKKPNHSHRPTRLCISFNHSHFTKLGLMGTFCLDFQLLSDYRTNKCSFSCFFS
jgi:hypothetical protein